MSYYRNYIENRSDWTFVGMYSDEGISATNTRHRDGFNRMIQDALDGKIDLIITKSVSRFARNTVDSLQNVRKLKEKGVEVYFEKENIWTLDSKGELLITIMSSLAQEESRSISENTTWGRRKSFADGKATVSYSRFLGYDKDFEINEEQAEIVRLIYRLFISGYGFHAIAQELMKRGIKAPAGGDKWYTSGIRSILTNEKYRGDALLQKEYTADFLQKTKKKNNGEIPQYYVEGHHKAIIPPQQFDYVQAEIARRKEITHQSWNSIFSNKVKCSCCGDWYVPKVWHSNDKYRRIIYQCNRRYAKEGPRCTSRVHLTEDQIKEYFVKALGQLVGAKEETIQNLWELMETVCNVDSLNEEKDALTEELTILANRVNNLIRENSQIAQDQTEFARKEEQLRSLYEEKHSRYDEINSIIQDKNNTRELLRVFIDGLNNISGTVEEFDELLWGGLVDHLEVGEDVIVEFKGGLKVTV